MTRTRTSPLHLDIAIKSDLWKSERDVQTALRRTMAAAAAHMRMKSAELSIVLTDDAAIRDLNRAWRGRDRPTNVLSFPTARHRTDKHAPRLLGDIVIAHETTAREAAAESKPLKNHVSHLAVHGFLHLLGYGHENPEEAEEMEAVERAILARLGIADPFGS